MLRLHHHSPTKLKVIAFVAVFVLYIPLGCSYAKGAPYVVEGKRFPDDKVSSVHEGMPAAEVSRILGEPYEIEHISGGELWRYYVWQRQEETIRYLGIIPVKKPLYSGVKEATLLLQGGVVQEVSFEHKRFD